jgi:hypothetical protein
MTRFSMTPVFFFELAAIAFLILILAIRYELKRGDDGPPDPPAGDVPNVPKDSR